MEKQTALGVDVQAGTVRSEAGMEDGGDPWYERAAHRGGSCKQYRRLVLPDKVEEYLGVVVLVMVGKAFCLFAGAGALRAANWLRDIGAPRIGLAVTALAVLSLSAGAIFLVRVLSRWSRGDW